MDLFSDILPPLQAPVPIGTVAQQFARSITPAHHPENPKPSRTPQTSRLGLPAPRMNPWQRNGRTMLAEATTNPDAAIRQAGLDWETQLVDLRTADTLEAVPGTRAVRRTDTRAILGVVGADFTQVTNRLLFDVFRDLGRAGADGNAVPYTIETAGSLQGGAVVWVLAHLPNLGIRIGDDESKTMLFISNGLIGNKMLTIAPTTYRIVCANSLRMAEAQARENRRHPGLAGGFTLKHTPGISAAINEAKAAFAATIASHAATKAAWQHLASKALTAKLEAEFMAQVFGRPGPDESDRAKALRKGREERIAAILASPTSQVRGTKDTAFSLMQAVVEYADHDRTTRTSDGGDADESRLMSATFGSGADVKAKAWEAALQVAA